MAFGFLKGVGDIVQGVAGVASLLDKPEEPKASKSAARSFEEAIKFAKASADPNSAAFKNLVALEEQSNRAAAIKQIQNFLRQNKRAKARGDISGIVNPERRDEAVMQALAKSFVDAEERARFSARDTLAQAAGVLAGSGSGLSPIAEIQNQVSMTDTKRKADLGQAIGAGIGALGQGLDRVFNRDSASPRPGTTRVTLE